MTSLARFTQSEIAKLLKAARGTGFQCVTIEVLAVGGLRAVYSATPAHTASAPNEWDVVFGEQPSALKTWQKKRRAEKASRDDT